MERTAVSVRSRVVFPGDVYRFGAGRERRRRGLKTRPHIIGLCEQPALSRYESLDGLRITRGSVRLSVLPRVVSVRHVVRVLLAHADVLKRHGIRLQIDVRRESDVRPSMVMMNRLAGNALEQQRARGDDVERD